MKVTERTLINLAFHKHFFTRQSLVAFLIFTTRSSFVDQGSTLPFTCSQTLQCQAKKQ